MTFFVSILMCGYFLNEKCHLSLASRNLSSIFVNASFCYPQGAETMNEKALTSKLQIEYESEIWTGRPPADGAVVTV